MTRNQTLDAQVFRQQWGHDPVDSEGSLINIGDTIELIRDYHYNKGEQAIVRCYVVDGHEFGVEFEHDSPGHSLDELLGNRASGLYVMGKDIKLIKQEVSVDEEAYIKNLTEEASKEPKLALIEGKFYALNLMPKATADEFAGSLMRSVSTRIAKVRSEASGKVALAEKKLIQMLVLPGITMDDVKKGMRIFKNGSYIVYIVPLHYAPKFVDENKRRHPTAELCDEHKKLLEQDVLLTVHVTKEDGVALVGTLKLDFDVFYHYHGNSSNCLGTAKPSIIKSPADIFVFRDRLQKALEIVNLRSLYDDDPPGLPTTTQLIEKLKPLTSTWSETPDIEVGSMVKILAEHDSSKDLTGLIGKVVCLFDNWTSVEFVVSKSFMHAGRDSTGKKGYCYDFPESKLQLMPPGTRRTRRVASPTTTSWIDEEEATTLAEIALGIDVELTNEEMEQRFGTINPDYGTTRCRRCGQLRGEHFSGFCRDERDARRRLPNVPWRVPIAHEAVPA